MSTIDDLSIFGKPTAMKLCAKCQERLHREETVWGVMVGMSDPVAYSARVRASLCKTCNRKVLREAKKLSSRRRL